MPGRFSARRSGIAPRADAPFDEEAEIVLLRVSANPAAEFSFSDPSIANNFIQEMEAETLAYMQSARSKLQKAGFRTSF